MARVRRPSNCNGRDYADKAFVRFLFCAASIVAIAPIFMKGFVHDSFSFQDTVDSTFYEPTKIIPNIGTSGKGVKGASSGMPKTLVIYFPQYHQDPVNDRNWGANFTDWDSLRDTPERNRHQQLIPRPLLDVPTTNTNDNLPPALGYYDLADRKPRKIQGILAEKFGIDGFIYHHYWFYDESDPGPTLAKPLENMLEDGHPDIPFMLNWCAVRWVNVWMGKAIFQTIPTNKNRAITLQEQYFNATDEMIYQHYQWLKPFFNHPNYIRVDGQPTLLMYSYSDYGLPILETLRRFAVEDGFPGLHFIVGRSSHHEDLYDTSHLNQKQYNRHLNVIRQRREDVDPSMAQTKARSIYTPADQLAMDEENLPRVVLKKWTYNPFNQTMTYPYPLWQLTKPYEVPKWCTKRGQSIRDDVNTNSTTSIPLPPQDHPEMIGIITNFDNTPRRKFKESKIWGGGDPVNGWSPEEALGRFSKSYEATLYYQKCCLIRPDASLEAPISFKSGDDRFVVINSWNEWAEGMAIEPSDAYGYRWLETIQAVQKRVKAQSCVFG
mmetsp:Transcript_12489/g.31446  ORF Transcript_12489/g.31446 Transcript_12489/m.31446 type:complete len:549 (-) Transcript_12489:74-1720(-)|eukprot:CAMPEP_0116080802 /NCGR_PEP_ID=MMETSP0327-20121206/1869_1 /TAXON_ID=44447 /ORGANISM="Pseudo-nitzschia delicatissima, Strain B596" /LENGTH=548 /DNA_ID=CAMNT_0003571517 /DNA_START=20 /DNA_END=1666 /DNA_ORIENTATION=+